MSTQTEKIGRMPTAEIVRGPWPALPARKRDAILDGIIKIDSEGDARDAKFKLIERTLVALEMSPVQFAELVLDVMGEAGELPTRYRRIDPPKMRRRV